MNDFIPGLDVLDPITESDVTMTYTPEQLEQWLNRNCKMPCEMYSHNPAVYVSALLELFKGRMLVDAEVVPFAWFCRDGKDGWDFLGDSKDPNGKLLGTWEPLYTPPPQAAEQVPVAYPSADLGYEWDISWIQDYGHGLTKLQREEYISRRAIDWYRLQPQPAQAPRDGVMEALINGIDDEAFSAWFYSEKQQSAFHRGAYTDEQIAYAAASWAFATLRQQVKSLTAKGEG